LIDAPFKFNKPNEGEPNRPMPTIYVVNGPNLNMLGKREPEIYGTKTLEHLKEALDRQAARHENVSLQHHQFNHEGDMLECLHAIFNDGNAEGLIINPGAWSHTSIALRDALAMLKIPIMEVHLSNIYAREAFRHHSYVSPLAEGILGGMGMHGYHMALGYLLAKI
jgi:3-dehydroquinate dehydratase II